MGGQAFNQKIIHIDDFNDESKTLWMPFGDDDLLEKTVETSLFSIIFFLMHHAKEKKVIRYYIDTLFKDYFFNGEVLQLTQRYAKTIKVINKVFLLATLILFVLDLGYFIWDKMSYEDLDHWFSELEKSGDAVTSYIRVPYTFEEGPHKIWAGLKTYTEAHVFGICAATGFTVGKVNQITLHGISPPTKPILEGVTTGNVGQEISLKMKSEDHDDGGDPLDYITDWDDGKTTTTNEDYNSGQQITQTHTYTSPGTYTITVTSIDCDNMQSEQNTHTIQVMKDDNPPIADITRPLNGLYLGDQQKFPGVPGTPPIIIGDITIKADAYDQEGIKQVTFKKDNIVFETDTSSQYSGKCYLPSNGFKLVDFKAIAEDYSGNQDTDTQKAFYWNTGSMTMTASNPLGNSPEAKKTYHIKITTPQGSTENQLKQGVDDLRDTLQDDYNDATITFTYKIDYGDDTPIQTIESEYPLLQLTHLYQDEKSHTIDVTLTTTLQINGQTHTHEDNYSLKTGEDTGNKNTLLRFLQRISERFPIFEKIIEIFLQFK